MPFRAHCGACAHPPLRHTRFLPSALHTCHTYCLRWLRGPRRSLLRWLGRWTRDARCCTGFALLRRYTTRTYGWRQRLNSYLLLYYHQFRFSTP